MLIRKTTTSVQESAEKTPLIVGLRRRNGRWRAVVQTPTPANPP